jgi:hypothetical protein
MSGDARGWRLALVPDALINPPDRERDRAVLPDVLGVLEANGYGVLQLPPLGGHGLLLAVIADQVAGMRTTAMRGGHGVHGEPGGLTGAAWLRCCDTAAWRCRPASHSAGCRRGVRGPEAAVFLSGYDLPPEEQHRWRV